MYVVYINDNLNFSISLTGKFKESEKDDHTQGHQIFSTVVFSL